MKVALLTREYPPDTAWGGIATVYCSLANALSRRGHEVHVICQAVGQPGESRTDGVLVHRVGSNAKRYSSTARINYSVSAWTKLREIVRKHGIEVVDATYWGAEALLYVLVPGRRVPVVVRSDVSALHMLRTMTYSGTRERLGLKILSYLERLAGKRADRVIAISMSLRDEAVVDLGINPQLVDLVHHGVDATLFRHVEANVREKLDIPQGAPFVLFVGRLEPRKGVHVLCEAIPEVLGCTPEARFVLVGSDTGTASAAGSVGSRLIATANHCGWGENLVILDQQPRDELVELYSACDVFVLPSLQEGFSMTILEALACGKPVVTTTAGGADDIGLAPPNGIAVAPGNVAELARGIVELLSLSEEEKRSVAVANREMIETRFSVPVWTDRVLAVYDKALREQ